MIVCHCRNITCTDIHTAIDWMRAADPDTVITPGKIYHALGTRAECGGCLPLFLSTMKQNANLPTHDEPAVPILKTSQERKARSG